MDDFGERSQRKVVDRRASVHKRFDMLTNGGKISLNQLGGGCDNPAPGLRSRRLPGVAREWHNPLANVCSVVVDRGSVGIDNRIKRLI